MNTLEEITINLIATLNKAEFYKKELESAIVFIEKELLKNIDEDKKMVFLFHKKEILNSISFLNKEVLNLEQKINNLNPAVLEAAVFLKNI